MTDTQQAADVARYRETASKLLRSETHEMTWDESVIMWANALAAAEERGRLREREALQARITELEKALDDADDPNRPPYGLCQHDGCNKWASVGTPTPAGYKWLCHWHWKDIDDAAKAAIRARTAPQPVAQQGGTEP